MASQRGAEVIGFPLAALLQPAAQAGGPVRNSPTSTHPRQRRHLTGSALRPAPSAPPFILPSPL